MHIISIVIPTFNRNKILITTIENLLNQSYPAIEILVIDQTIFHDNYTERKLNNWNCNKVIRWIRLTKPSIPIAMNIGLIMALSPIVLFLDDDISPSQKLIEMHSNAYDKSENIWAVAGQVIQPNENPISISYKNNKNFLTNYLDFSFYSKNRAFVENVMACNLSVLRKKAIDIGGFDENFLPPVAYRFETEFAKRIIESSGKIQFEPNARIDHLRVSEGGTRTSGSHLSSASPIHGSGDYYYALKHGKNYVQKFLYISKRPFREIRTKFHLKKPWWAPVKFIGEIRALLQAIILYKKGPKYIQPLNTYNHLIL